MKTAFPDYIKNPVSLQPGAIELIEKAQKEFPYFQTARILALQHTYIYNRDYFNEKLKNIAHFIPERRILQELFMPLKPVTDNQEHIKGEALSDNLSEISTDTKTPVSDSLTMVSKERENIVTSPNPPEGSSETGQTRIKGKRTGKKTLRENISDLLEVQVFEMENADLSMDIFIPDTAIDIEKEYEDTTKDNEASAEPDPSLLTVTDDIMAADQKPASERHDNNYDDILLEILELDEIVQENQGAAEIIIPSDADNGGLIEEFLRNNPRIGPVKDDVPKDDVSVASIKEHDSLFTETLAKIYLKQGYFNKAILAYEKLILKYPEKSDYFAALIDEIKNNSSKL